MRIILHDNYQNAGGLRLKPGEYDIADERLQGLGMYLLKTEHASIVIDINELPIVGSDGIVTTIDLGSETEDTTPHDEIPSETDDEDPGKDDIDPAKEPAPPSKDDKPKGKQK